MSDTEKSGAALDEPTATTPAAQASGDQCASAHHHGESTTEQASQPDAQQQASDFAFGTSRGSGLARGKRKTATVPDTPAAQANANGYQPTAIEVITPKSEYSNPFTGETVVETPPQEDAPKGESPPDETPATAAIQPEEEKVAAPEGLSGPKESETTSTAAAIEAPPKTELKILPPAQPNRGGQSWESSSLHPAHRAAAATASDGEKANNDSAAEAPRSRSPRGSSEGRPTFQPERRSRSPRSSEADERPDRPEKPHREERLKRESREPRERVERSERAPRAASSPAKPAAAKPQGFFGWLKSLFGGGNSKSSTRRSKAAHSSEPRHEGGPRRRSRGGRSNGPRSSSESFSGHRSGGKTMGERASPNRNSEEQRDRPRNRSRGGRGGRGRSGPRSEGQQSGGAI